MGLPVSLHVEVGGTGKTYKSLDDLEYAIRMAGGPDAFRRQLLDDGFGHVRVADEEFGVNSYVGLF